MTILTVKDVRKHFGGAEVLRGVSLGVERGQITGLIGANGAGKTTLFNCICGTIRPDGGEICYMGRRIDSLPPHSVCCLGIARTFQLVRPLEKLTVLENVMTGAVAHFKKYDSAERFAREKLAFVGLSDMACMPAGQLNIGGQRRLELARSLATQPELLLLDEVMAGLTPGETDEAMELIRRIRDSGVTVLMIEHIMRALMVLSDTVFALDGGELIASGTPQQIVRDSRVIAAYLGGKTEDEA